MSLRLRMGVLQGAPLPVGGVEGQAGLDARPWSWWYYPLSTCCWHSGSHGAALASLHPRFSVFSAAPSPLAILEEGNPCCAHRASGKSE